MPVAKVGNIQGPPGPQGARGATGQGYTWQGNYSSSVAYVAYDTVALNGSSYVCITDNTGLDPSTDDGTNWQLLAKEGDEGPLGAQGPVGPAGVGPAGPTGADGATGPQGPPGPQGSGYDIAGTVADQASLPATANDGDIYVTTDTGSSYIYSTASNSWTDLGPVQTGPAGPAGSDGPTGPTGPAGATGPQGVAGSQWFVGQGALVNPYPGANPGDWYLDSDTGDVYSAA